MIEENDKFLMKDLFAIAAGLDQMSKKLPIYLTKIASMIGLYPCLSETIDNLTVTPNTLQISSLAYFILIIKGIKDNYSYGDLYTHCLLTQPMRREYQQMINLILIYHNNYSNRIDFDFYQSYYDAFTYNQGIIIQSKHDLNKSITKHLLLATISSIFSSKDINTFPMTIDYLITELKKVCEYFCHFNKDLRKKMLMLVYPSTYTTIIFNNGNHYKERSSMINTVVNRTQRIYTSCYYPLEYLSVVMIDKAINLKANLTMASSYIKELIIDSIRSEVNKLQSSYGRLAASIRIKQNNNEVDFVIDHNLLKINRNWLEKFIEKINDNILYVKAKDVIDSCYMKWLSNDTTETNEDDGFLRIQSDSISFIAENNKNKETISQLHDSQIIQILSDADDKHEYVSIDRNDNCPRISFNDLIINEKQQNIDNNKDNMIELSFIENDNNNNNNKDWRFRDAKASLKFKQGKKKCKPSKISNKI